MEEATSASEVAKKVNILDAIMWLKSAWDEVQPASIQKCFSKCGFSEQLLQCHENEEVEENDDLQGFVAELGMTWDEYCNFDETVATYVTIENNWEENLVASCSAREEFSSDEDEDATPTPAPVISSGVALTSFGTLPCTISIELH